MESRFVTGMMIAAVVVLVAIAGCMEKNGGEGEGEVADVGQVRGYADPITEQILVAMNEDYYTRYSEDFDQTMKNIMTKAVFVETDAVINSKIGDYVSKEFWKAEIKDQYTIVHYNATFTDEPGGVTVKVTFQEINDTMKVSGLWLDSPKLRM